MKSTLKDIAGRARVTSTTVSFVLNSVKKAKIKTSTRSRILRAARELEYIQNPFAQNLKKASKLGITMLIPSLEDYVSRKIISLIKNEIRNTEDLFFLHSLDDHFNIKILSGFRSISRCFVAVKPFPSLLVQEMEMATFPLFTIAHRAGPYSADEDSLTIDYSRVLSALAAYAGREKLLPCLVKNRKSADPEKLRMLSFPDFFPKTAVLDFAKIKPPAIIEKTPALFLTMDDESTARCLQEIKTGKITGRIAALYDSEALALYNPLIPRVNIPYRDIAGFAAQFIAAGGKNQNSTAVYAELNGL